MMMGRDEFRERFGGDGTVGGRQPEGRLWGGDGYLPFGGAPPGARFDPVGPAVSCRLGRRARASADPLLFE